MKIINIRTCKAGEKHYCRPHWRRAGGKLLFFQHRLQRLIFRPILIYWQSCCIAFLASGDTLVPLLLSSSEVAKAKDNIFVQIKKEKRNFFNVRFPWKVPSWNVLIFTLYYIILYKICIEKSCVLERFITCWFI